MVTVWPVVFFLLVLAAGGAVGLVLLLRWLLKSRSAQSVVVSGLIGAGIIALFGLLFVLIMIPVRMQESRRLEEHIRSTTDEAQRRAGSSQHASVWREVPPGPEAPAWVTDEALMNPEPQRVRNGPWPLTYVCPDAQERLAGYSLLEPDAARARARAWKSLRKRLGDLFLARCMIEAPNELRRDGPTRVARCVNEIVVERPEFGDAAAQVFEEEVDRPEVPGKLFRAAVLVTVPPALIHEIAAAALTQAAAALRAEREAFRNRVYAGGGAVFLLFVILSIYLFLSAHTRGIFTWPLRLAAVLLYLAAVFGFVMLVYNLS